MFYANSRYAAARTVELVTARGEHVTAIEIPIRARPTSRGFHTRTAAQRLDALAAHYLADATATWRLCDVSGTVAPDALAARDRVAVPR